MASLMRDYSEYDVGAHMHSTREGAAAKVLAAYDAGCRRFDAAIGGLGGCPFAQDELVGNIPTEVVLEALEQRGVRLPIKRGLDSVMARNGDISSKFSE
jgi:hydroxymethylglutaryl-CoA lyase